MSTHLDWRHSVTDIPEHGLTMKRSADGEVRAFVAAELDIMGCSRLDARYEIKSLGHGGYLLSGQLNADVTQACVITLEPVEERIDEPFEVEFRPGETLTAEFDAMETRDIEPLIDGLIPVGRIVYEQLASALNPYPRKEGAEHQSLPEKQETPEARGNPFAVLKNLKPKT